MSSEGATQDPSQPVPELCTWAAASKAARVTRLARLRVPVTLTARPWATLYRLPDGRRLWCLRLWDGNAPRRRCVTTARLLEYARASGLRELERALRAADATADAPEA